MNRRSRHIKKFEKNEKFCPNSQRRFFLIIIVHWIWPKQLETKKSDELQSPPTPTMVEIELTVRQQKAPI